MFTPTSIPSTAYYPAGNSSICLVQARQRWFSGAQWMFATAPPETAPSALSRLVYLLKEMTLLAKPDHLEKD
jgi:hypothetical protein